MIWCLCYWYFFFFKQKTAYEMRISDWSSDVCSSDLQHAFLVLRGHCEVSEHHQEHEDVVHRQRFFDQITGQELGGFEIGQFPPATVVEPEPDRKSVV